jgi:hypothetical protein
VDLSGLLLIPLAAVITACWVIGTAAFTKRGRGLRGPFLLSCGLGVLLMEPWRIASWQHLGMFTVMLVMLVLWVAAGCIIGGVPAALAISVGRKLRQRFGR